MTEQELLQDCFRRLGGAGLDYMLVGSMAGKAFVAAPEDVILYKFRWYTISPSERQLSDIAGIWSVSGKELDLEYMRHWAMEIGVAEWMTRLERGELKPKTT